VQAGEGAQGAFSWCSKVSTKQRERWVLSTRSDAATAGRHYWPTRQGVCSTTDGQLSTSQTSLQRRTARLDFNHRLVTWRRQPSVTPGFHHYLTQRKLAPAFRNEVKPGSIFSQGPQASAMNSQSQRWRNQCGNGTVCFALLAWFLCKNSLALCYVMMETRSTALCVFVLPPWCHNLNNGIEPKTAFKVIVKVKYDKNSTVFRVHHETYSISSYIDIC